MSHLQVAADAPILIRAAAGAALYGHIGGATLGLASGALAMVAKKGGRLHRAAGNVFFVAMLAMAGIGAVVAPMVDDVGSTFGGGITFYLVLTGWRAGRSREVKGGAFEIAGMALLGVAIVAVLMLGRTALASPDRSLSGEPWFVFFVVAAIAALMAALDLKVVLGPALVGAARLSRHIWRMGLGLFVALMSALAQPLAGGLLFHGPTVNLQWIPVGALVLSIAYWLVRVRRTGGRTSRKPQLFAAPEATS